MTGIRGGLRIWVALAFYLGVLAKKWGVHAGLLAALHLARCFRPGQARCQGKRATLRIRGTGLTGRAPLARSLLHRRIHLLRLIPLEAIWEAFYLA